MAWYYHNNYMVMVCIYPHIPNPIQLRSASFSPHTRRLILQYQTDYLPKLLRFVSVLATPNTPTAAMADTPVASPSEPRTPPSSASEQARLRKERREAKIRAGGSARLDKITGLGGGIPRGQYTGLSPLSPFLRPRPGEQL